MTPPGIHSFGLRARRVAGLGDEAKLRQILAIMNRGPEPATSGPAPGWLAGAAQGLVGLLKTGATGEAAQCAVQVRHAWPFWELSSW